MRHYQLNYVDELLN